MKKCSRCNKRPAVIFINEIKGDKVTSKGLCFHCAKEMNIKPFVDYIEKMGIRDEDMETLEQQMGQMFAGMDEEVEGMPSMDLQSLFGGAMMPVAEEKDEEEPGEVKKEKGKNTTQK